jgi:hypothetical protein
VRHAFRRQNRTLDRQVVMSDKTKTPSCGFHEELVSYMYDEAAPAEARRFEQHLAECSRCREEMAAFKRVRSMLQSWELNDVPVVRVSPAAPRRSALDVLKELLTITPVWVKAFGAVAAAMIVLSVIGTDISVGSDGLKFRTNIFGRTAQPLQAKNPGDSRLQAAGLSKEEAVALIDKMVAQSELKMTEQMKSEVQTIQAEIKSNRSSDLVRDVARIAARIQDHRERIQELERDIDRREGLGLTDLFSRAVDDGKKDVAAEHSDVDGGR